MKKIKVANVLLTYLDSKIGVYTKQIFIYDRSVPVMKVIDKMNTNMFTISD